MQDFDTERDARMQGDRTFKIGGEVFSYRPAVAPEALVRWADMDTETGESEAIAIIDHTVLAFLSPGQEEKWARIRSSDLDNPITASDMVKLVQWLVEEQTGRPTTPPSDSSNGSESGKPGTPLTAVPVSAEVQA